MRISRRIHVPLVTHDKVKFHASNEPKRKPAMRGFGGAAPANNNNGKEVVHELLPVNDVGNIVELNNAMTHYVDNEAPIDRIHLIIDYMADVPNELTYDEAMCLFANDFQSCKAI